MIDSPEPVIDSPEAVAPEPVIDSPKPVIDSPEAVAPEPVIDSSDVSLSDIKVVEMTVKQGDSAWTMMEDHLTANNIDLGENKNKAIVHMMQEVARLNPDIESIHCLQIGQIINLPDIEHVSQANLIISEIEVSASNNVLDSHEYTDKMKLSVAEARVEADALNLKMAASPSKVIDEILPVTEEFYSASPELSSVEYTVMCDEDYERYTGKTTGFIFDASPQNKIENISRIIANDMSASIGATDIETKFVEDELNKMIMKNNPLNVTSSGNILIPVGLNELDFIKIVNGINDEYIGEYIMGSDSVKAGSSFSVNNDGIVSANSKDEIAMSMAKDLQSRMGITMTNEEVAAIYRVALSNIEESNISGEFKLSDALVVDVMNGNALKVESKVDLKSLMGLRL